jgi:hypothetical protein
MLLGEVLHQTGDGAGLAAATATTRQNLPVCDFDAEGHRALLSEERSWPRLLQRWLCNDADGKGTVLIL